MAAANVSKKVDAELKEISARGIEKFTREAEPFSVQRKLAKIQKKIEDDEVQPYEIFWLFDLVFCEEDLNRLTEIFNDDTEKITEFLITVLVGDVGAKK